MRSIYYWGGLLGLLFGRGEAHAAYPRHWWQSQPGVEAPAWEILPEAAGPGEVILSKRNELGILSNFAPTPFEMRGRRYASLEGFWQSLKFPENANDPRAASTAWPYQRSEVEQLTAFAAKTAGKAADEINRSLGINWISLAGERIFPKGQDQDRHYAWIVEATRAKLAQNPEVKRILLSTGDLKLRPDHHTEPTATKAYRYFDIYMELRRELQAGRSERSLAFTDL